MRVIVEKVVEMTMNTAKTTQHATSFAFSAFVSVFLKQMKWRTGGMMRERMVKRQPPTAR